jgi:hypothetical protein
MGIYYELMPRAAATSDAFHAASEFHRREFSYLALKERAVGDIVARSMFYRTSADAIRLLHEWTGTFECLWRNQSNRVKDRADGKLTESDQISRRKHMILTATRIENLTLQIAPDAVLEQIGRRRKE